MLVSAEGANTEHLLSCVTFGGGVERSQLNTVEVLWPHLVQNLLKRMELTVGRVHVVLVDLETVAKKNPQLRTE